MDVTINIDTGGTFTDGYFTRAERAARVKVDTTPHDLTECLARCVAQGAERLGYATVQELLLDASVFRFSSTIGTNSIIQRTGPRIGLLVSAGATDDLYGEGDGDEGSPLYEFFVRRDLVAGVVDPHDEDEVRGHVRRLLVGGARILVTSLAGSEDDPGGEDAIKRVVQREYPRHYLGAIPCLTASEVTPRPGAQRRTATAVINAYLHPDMVRILYQADEDLRSEGYPHPLLIVHASGGVARVAKTRAIETYNSGPVGGVHGAGRMAAHYGIEHAVAMDVGGTSTDVSIIRGGQVPFTRDPVIAGAGVHTPMVRVDAIGGGGGSIARRDGEGYRIGPDSAGAAPGPACYGLGGTQPTASDAEVVLGHIDPDWFLGGRRKLDVVRARSAIERIAGDDDVETAAWRVHRALVDVAAAKVSQMCSDSGTPVDETSLFAFGGGGGLYGAEVAEACGIPRVLAFAQSSVFSAFGIAGMDVSHVYEVKPGPGVVERLQRARERAALDAAGEHLDPDVLRYVVEAELDGDLLVVEPSEWDDDREAEALRLRATAPTSRAPIDVGPTRGPDPSAAKKEQRTVHRPGSTQEATVYDRDRLQPGNVVEGPALVESDDTTILVPHGMRLSIDEHRTAVIEW